jgi:hypothetical protein
MNKRVREPVQVYLETSDRSLLDQLARATGLSRAEVLRRGMRQMAAAALGAARPGSSLDRLVGALGDDPSIPADLAARHDQYLYGSPGDAGSG